MPGYNRAMGRSPRTQHDICDLLQTHHVLSALELLEKMQQTEPQLNRTTVYRALDKLLEEGKVCRHIFGNDTLVYELRTDHHHDHLVCERCGKVESIECQTKNRSSISGFTISHHHTSFFGICAACNQR